MIGQIMVIDLGNFGRCFNCTDNRGLHCHQCDNCSAVWQHPECSRYMGAHNCPRCGTPNRWKMPLDAVKHIDYEWQEGTSDD